MILDERGLTLSMFEAGRVSGYLKDVERFAEPTTAAERFGNLGTELGRRSLDSMLSVTDAKFPDILVGLDELPVIAQGSTLIIEYPDKLLEAKIEQLKEETQGQTPISGAYAAKLLNDPEAIQRTINRDVTLAKTLAKSIIKILPPHLIEEPFA